MTTSHHSSSDSSRAFGRLATPVQRWIWDKEWSALHDIQERAIPLLLDTDDDLIITAATAGGKTEAAFLPLISSVIQAPGAGGFDLVYIGPLRALITDQFGRLEELCEKADLPVYPWHGDISASVKKRARADPRGILLITPESLEALFVLRGLEIPRLFASTRCIVIDELHALLDNERGIHMRSLLTRLEMSLGRRVRRVGLSATLGDMDLAKAYLRPDAADAVHHLDSISDGKELLVQLRGYRAGSNEGDESKTSVEFRIARHIFEKLRGEQNLVFAGSRGAVEEYSDRLRRMCEADRLPNEFYPHHASLSRDHRSFVETRLKDARLPTTAICTSTLELGIDIGEVACVGQIGAPWSVAALRQRLGRSGRRAGRPAVLRMYVSEREVSAKSGVADALRLSLFRAVAMIDLLIDKRCEPPQPQALHLSTLVHQILSVIAEKGGAPAGAIYDTLCVRGPFRLVDKALFASVLRQIGGPDVELVEQAPDGVLLLGRGGERLVEHYSFYAVFQSPEEYRVVAGGKTLGTLPVVAVLAVGMTIIFGGRRWRIKDVHDRDKVIEVTPDATGRPPPFGGDAGLIHDMVIKRMRQNYLSDAVPVYLDGEAKRLLAEGRAAFKQFGLDQAAIQTAPEGGWIVATWAGTAQNAALALALKARGFDVEQRDGLLEVASAEESLPAALAAIAAAPPPDVRDLLKAGATLISEKFHEHLSDELIALDASSAKLDLAACAGLAAAILAE